MSVTRTSGNAATAAQTPDNKPGKPVTLTLAQPKMVKSTVDVANDPSPALKPVERPTETEEELGIRALVEDTAARIQHRATIIATFAALNSNGGANAR